MSMGNLKQVAKAHHKALSTVVYLVYTLHTGQGATTYIITCIGIVVTQVRENIV